MAISNIVLRSGVGPTATIALFITHGLGSGASIAAIDTHDGFRKKKPHVDDAEIKRIGRELRKKELEKLAYAEQLRKQLRKTINPTLELIEEAEEALTPAQFIEAQADRSLLLHHLLEKAENEIKLLQIQAKAHEIMVRQARDEEDIRAILMAMQLPLRTVH